MWEIDKVKGLWNLLVEVIMILLTFPTFRKWKFESTFSIFYRNMYIPVQ